MPNPLQSGRHRGPGDGSRRIAYAAKGSSAASSVLETALGLRVPLTPEVQTLVQWCAAGIALAGLVAFLGYPAESWQNLAGAVAADMGGTAWLLVRLGRTAEGTLVVNPLTALLGAYALRRLIGLIHVLGQRTSLESPYDGIAAAAYVAASAKAEWVTLAGTGAFCCGWLAGRQRRSEVIHIQPFTHWHDTQLWAAYGIGLAVFLSYWLSGGALSALGSSFSVTSGFAYGTVFVLLVFSRDFGTTGKLRYLAYAALLPLFVSSLTVGMKSAFFYALLPAWAAYLLRRPRRGLVFSFLIVFFLLIFVFPYIGAYRAMNWGTASGATVQEVSQVTSESVEYAGVWGTLAHSWSQFELRFGSVNEAGAVVYLADRTGFMGSFFLQNLTYGFVPRFLWPQKPSWDPAVWFTTLLSGGASDTPGTSSTALHLGPELYWMYGWSGTALGLLVLGLFYRKVSDGLLKAGKTAPVFLAAWYSFFIFVCFLEEVRYNMAIIGSIILVSNAFVVSWLVKTVIPQRHAPRLIGSQRRMLNPRSVR